MADLIAQHPPPTGVAELSTQCALTALSFPSGLCSTSQAALDLEPRTVAKLCCGSGMDGRSWGADGVGRWCIRLLRRP